jgi:hypothetical protein
MDRHDAAAVKSLVLEGRRPEAANREGKTTADMANGPSGQREPAAKPFWRTWRRPPGGKSSSVPQIS